MLYGDFTKLVKVGDDMNLLSDSITDAEKQGLKALLSLLDKYDTSDEVMYAVGYLRSMFFG